MEVKGWMIGVVTAAVFVTGIGAAVATGAWKTGRGGGCEGEAHATSEAQGQGEGQGGGYGAEQAGSASVFKGSDPLTVCAEKLGMETATLTAMLRLPADTSAETTIRDAAGMLGTSPGALKRALEDYAAQNGIDTGSDADAVGSDRSSDGGCGGEGEEDCESCD